MNKSMFAVICLLLPVVPFLSGGRDPLSLMLSFFGVGLAAFLTYRTWRPVRLPLAVTIAATGLGAWAALSLFWTVNRFETELWLLYYLLGFLVFWIAYRLTDQSKRYLVNGYLWLAAVTALYGIFIYLTGGYERLTSTFYWANPAAAYLLPAAFISGWRWAISRAWDMGVLALILGSALILTDSRGILLVSVGVLGLFGLFSLAVRRRWLPILGLVATSLVLAWGFTGLRGSVFQNPTLAPGSRLAEAAQGESSSVSDRLNYLSSTIEIWKEHPLGGSGAGTFQTLHPQVQHRVISASSDAHNFYLQTLSDLGLVGLGLVLALAILLLTGSVRGAIASPLVAPYAAGALALALHFGLDIDDRYPALIAVFGLMAALSYRPMAQEKTHLSIRAATVAAVLLGIMFSTGWFLSEAQVSRGQASDSNRDYVTAAADYAKAHAGPMYDPDNWTAEGIDYYTLAGLTGGSKRYSAQAEQAVAQAIRRDRLDSQHYQLLGRVKLQEGDSKAAIDNFKKALSLDPYNHPGYYLDLAVAQIKSGDSADGYKTAEQGIALYPSAVVANRSAQTDVKPAVASLLSIRALRELGVGQKELARRDLSAADKLDPGNINVKDVAAKYNATP
jgi:exopolysaccharide production protein ExoQ